MRCDGLRGAKADVYVAGTDPLHRWGLARRRRLELAGAVLHVAPPEYVIVRKLEYYREGGSEKHVRDIQGMLRHHGTAIDLHVVEEKVAGLGLVEAWRRARDLGHP